MDGTIANLYEQEDWLQRLRNEDKTIFLECKPMVTQEQLFKLFPPNQYEIVILTITPKDCTKEYHNKVIEQKQQLLKLYFPSLQKNIFKKYGHNKNLKNCGNALLIDDNAEIRNNFKGIAINPSNLW